MVSYFVTFFPVKTFSSMLDVVHFFFFGGGQGGVGGLGYSFHQYKQNLQQLFPLNIVFFSKEGLER